MVAAAQPSPVPSGEVSIHSSGVCSPPPVVTPIAMAGTPAACAAFASVLAAVNLAGRPAARSAAAAAAASGWVCASSPAGRRPSSSVPTVICSLGARITRRARVSRSASAAAPVARRSARNIACRARALTASPPENRPTLTEDRRPGPVPAPRRGSAASPATIRAAACTALGAPACSQACPPGPDTVTRQRTEPTPMVAIRPR